MSNSHLTRSGAELLIDNYKLIFERTYGSLVDAFRLDGVDTLPDYLAKAFNTVVRLDVVFTDKSLHQQAKAWANRTYQIGNSAYKNGAMTKKYKELYRKKHGTIAGAFRSDSAEDVDGFDEWLDFGDYLIHIEDIDELFPAINDDERQVFDGGDRQDDLDKWFNKEGWQEYDLNGNVVGPCGGRSGKKGRGKPKCLSKQRAAKMTKAEIAAAVRRKRREDPNPDRSGEPIHVSTHSKNDAEDTEMRSDALRLTELPTVGSRVKFKGRLYVPNKPYRSGDRFVVLATRNGYAKLISFTAEDVDLSKEHNPHTSAYWANLYHSFGSPQVEEAEATDDRTDGEAIEVSGDILDESELESESVVDLLQTLENIFGGDE